MTDYISREYVLKCMEDSRKNAGISEESASKVRKWLYKAPAADVRPVVRGKWENVDVFWLCSKCHYAHGRSNFCPNCGAMMEES